MDKKKIIYDFLNEQIHAVLATVNAENKPEGAFIGFGLDEQMNIVFGTGIKTRKFANIQNNPHVALTITDAEKRITVQYEGEAKELIKEELDKCKQLYFHKLPSARKFESSTNRYFKVTPTWIRYSDINETPWKIFELTDF